jgi:hypothetical protein
MSTSFPRVLDSRYVHTGNSGVTIAVSRSERLPDRADLCIYFGAMGSTDMTFVSKGMDMKGYTAQQLRDLATVLLRSAYELERPPSDQWFESEFQGSPRIFYENSVYASETLLESAEVLREKANELLFAIHAVRRPDERKPGLLTSDYLDFHKKEWARGAREERIDSGCHIGTTSQNLAGACGSAVDWEESIELSEKPKVKQRRSSRRVSRAESASR